MKDLFLGLGAVDADSQLPRALKSTCVSGVVERAVCDDPVDLTYKLWRQPFVPELDDTLHRAVVVEDHLLAAVTGGPVLPQHLLGPYPRGRGPLQLRGRHRLLDEGAHEVAISRRGVSDGLGQLDLPPRSRGHVIDGAQERVWQVVSEPGPVLHRERSGPGGLGSAQPHGHPPLLACEASWRIVAKEPLPGVIVGVRRCRRRHEHLSQAAVFSQSSQKHLQGRWRWNRNLHDTDPHCRPVTYC